MMVYARVVGRFLAEVDVGDGSVLVVRVYDDSGLTPSCSMMWAPGCPVWGWGLFDEDASNALAGIIRPSTPMAMGTGSPTAACSYVEAVFRYAGRELPPGAVWDGVGGLLTDPWREYLSLSVVCS